MNPYQTAKSQGYSDEEIVEYLSEHPDYSEKITMAKEQGYTPNQIGKYLRNQKTPPKPKEDLTGQTITIGGKEFPLEELGESPFQEGTKEDLQRYGTDVIAGMGGMPHALAKFPESVANQIETLISGNEKPPKGIEEGQSALFRGIDWLASFLPEMNEIRQGMTDEEATALDRYIMAAAGGAPFGPAGAATMAGFQGLEEGLEAIDASPRVKAGARLAGIAATGAKTKKGIQPKNAAEAEMLRFFDKYNIPEEQQSIALSKLSNAKKWVSKIASKKGKTEAILEATGEGIGEVYEVLREQPSADTVLAPMERSRMQGRIEEIMEDLPKSVRKSIEGDVQEFFQSPQTGADMINLWQDINQAFIGKKKQLQRLKEPLLEGLKTIDVEFAKDFQSANKAYSNFQEVRNIMKPGDWGFFSHLKGPAAVVGYILKGTPMGALKLGIPAYALSKLAREMIINPKLKNISKKLGYGISKRSLGASQVALKELADEMDNIDPEIATMIRSIDAKELLPSDKKRRTTQ